MTKVTILKMAIAFTLGIVIVVSFSFFALQHFDNRNNYIANGVPSQFSEIKLLPSVFYQTAYPYPLTVFNDSSVGLGENVRVFDPGFYKLFLVLQTQRIKNAYVFSNISLSQGSLDVALVCASQAQFIAQNVNSTFYSELANAGFVYDTQHFLVTTLNANSTLYYYTQNLVYYYAIIGWNSQKVAFVYYSTQIPASVSQLAQALRMTLSQSCP